MENKYLTLKSAVEEAVTRLDGDLLIDNAGTVWDTDNLLDEIAAGNGEDIDDGYYCVGHDGSIGVTHDDGHNVTWLYKVTDMNTVKRLRLNAGFTQTALAEATGLNIRHIQKIEAGEVSLKNITASTSSRLAAALGVTMEELMQLGHSPKAELREAASDTIDYIMSTVKEWEMTRGESAALHRAQELSRDDLKLFCEAVDDMLETFGLQTAKDDRIIHFYALAEDYQIFDA